MQTIGSQGFLIAATAKFAVSYTAIYHYLGALRHFAWDFYPDMLTNTEVEKSAYVLLGGSAVLAGATVFF
jgi:succinate dehydrogenase/fumarate reductase cytochrome b subunit